MVENWAEVVIGSSAGEGNGGVSTGVCLKGVASTAAIVASFVYYIHSVTASIGEHCSSNNHIDKEEFIFKNFSYMLDQ